jgi:Zn-dependent protease/predicted transcriptional regulator
MRWSFTIGRLFGIRIELHVTFVLFIGWIALSQGLLTGNAARALEAVVLLLLVFACVLLHELGHALTARRFGIVTRDIILLPIGGVARLERMPDRPWQEIVVAIAGPLVNVAIALALLAVRQLRPGPAPPVSMSGGMLDTLLIVNLAMILFNMIPAFPMDGGRVLRAVLALRLDYARATRIASVIGQGIAMLFGIVGLVNSNYMLILVALFVFIAASDERVLVSARASLAGVPVSAAMLTDFHHLDPADPLQRAVDYLMAGSQQDFPVVERDRPVGVLTRGDLIRALHRAGKHTPVGEVIRRNDDFADAAEPLQDAVLRMRSGGRSSLPVLRDGQLVGFLTLDNVGDLLLVRDALKRYSAGA